MIINPRKIKLSDLPLIVLADNTRSFMGLLIKLHSRGAYSHIMTMCREGYFASQGWMYKEVKIEKYLKKYRLKFWICKDLTEEERIEWIALTKKELNEPWWKRRYDIIGVGIGQLFNIRWFNNFRTKYCSERVANKIRLLGLYVKKHRTPSEINFLLRISDRFEVYGHYLPE